MESKKTTGCVENFKGEFWRRVKTNRVAWDVMHRVPGEKHNRVVRLLGVASDPGIDEQMREVGNEICARLVHPLFRPAFSRKELRNMARRLRGVGKDVDRMFGIAGVSVNRDLFLQFAEDCRARAKALSYLDMARQMDFASNKPLRTLTSKAFWRHLPLAMLCRELEVPRSVSHGEIEELLSCAYSARGRKRRPPRSVEREYKAFLRLKPNNPLKSAVWAHLVQRLLDKCLPIIPSTK
jgi:hypothetical protein